MAICKRYHEMIDASLSDEINLQTFQNLEVETLRKLEIECTLS